MEGFHGKEITATNGLQYILYSRDPRAVIESQALQTVKDDLILTILTAFPFSFNEYGNRF